MKENMEKYVSGKLNANERNIIEASLFSEIVCCRILEII
jgi:hypothetical protein